ncbi:WhiB family transcriptional regulator [Streptomyces lydicus]|uniref:WhiB family transcriptional regulator n=1 Tax=Streptomyces lydicus TaxID=47763 RepID=UPI00332314CA
MSPASITHWSEQALCRQEDPDEFSPAVYNTATVREPKAICNRCPVEAKCLEEAFAEEAGLPHQFRSGIRGGTTPRERAAIDKRSPRPAAA